MVVFWCKMGLLMTVALMVPTSVPIADDLRSPVVPELALGSHPTDKLEQELRLIQEEQSVPPPD
ncbi:exported protein of unknown function [Nitrospira moscoviensis]|uniref:Uncharacterized protein n=1 Tax=Nitrospira moscoviensis TaxID=42253 RepID=A0A0K2G956_NITMO|nr:exported protein of unknown function [Nitrospira moscoviensis]